MQPDIKMPKPVAIRELTLSLGQSSTLPPSTYTIHSYGTITISTSRENAGEYTITITSDPNLDCTTQLSFQLSGGIVPGFTTIIPRVDNTLSIFTYNGAGAAADGIMLNTQLTIKIYDNV